MPLSTTFREVREESKSACICGATAPSQQQVSRCVRRDSGGGTRKKSLLLTSAVHVIQRSCGDGKVVCGDLGMAMLGMDSTMFVALRRVCMEGTKCFVD